jgi:hypothetical protein
MKTLKEKRVVDKTILYVIYQSVDEADFENIIGATTSKKA